MKKILVIFTLAFIGYMSLRWDYYVSNYIFKNLCSDKKKIGLFIFKKIELGNEYFTPIPSNKDPRDVDQRFLFGKTVMLNKKMFNKYYLFHAYKRIPVSNIGPIYLVETSITEKATGRTISKAVSARNENGWLAKLSSFGYGYTQCPARNRASGEAINEHMYNHLFLIKNTVIRKKIRGE